MGEIIKCEEEAFHDRMRMENYPKVKIISKDWVNNSLIYSFTYVKEDSLCHTY